MKEAKILRVRSEKCWGVKSSLNVIPDQPSLLVSLNEPKHELRRRLDINPEEEKDVSSLAEPPKQGFVAHTPPEFPYRLALNSYNLIDALQEHTGEILTDSKNVFIRPFKLLLVHEEGIRKALNEYQSKCAEHCSNDLLPGQEDTDATNESDDTGIIKRGQDVEKEVNMPTVVVSSDSSKPSANKVTNLPSTKPKPPASEPKIVKSGTDKDTKAQADTGKEASKKDKQQNFW